MSPLLRSPAQKRVRVTVTLRLTNQLKDTATKRFYFDEAFLAVLNLSDD